MSIKILNNESELNSFPSSQSIILLSDTRLEEATFANNIILFRLQSEHNLISLAEPYSYSLGYLKETFDRAELSFKSEETPEGYKITCTPTKKLNLDSRYCLYISSELSNKVISVEKRNSVSASNISVSIKDNFNLRSTFTLKIEETSYIVSNKNIVRASLDGVVRTLDVRTSNKIIFNDLEITLEDTIYAKGEEFIITIDPYSKVTEDLVTYINTVNSGTINPIPKSEASTKISNASVLEFYSKLSNNKPEVITKSVPKYLDTNIFSIKLPEGYILDTTSNDLKVSVSLAFNNYLLKNLKLYEDNNKYKVIVYVDEFEGEVIFELLYSDDKEQSEKVIVDLSNIEELR